MYRGSCTDTVSSQDKSSNRGEQTASQTICVLGHVFASIPKGIGARERGRRCRGSRLGYLGSITSDQGHAALC